MCKVRATDELGTKKAEFKKQQITQDARFALKIKDSNFSIVKLAVTVTKKDNKQLC